MFVSISLIDALVPRGPGVPEAERDSVLDEVAGFVRAEGALAPLPIRLGLAALSLALLAWLGILGLGRAYMEFGREDLAAESFRRVVKLSPDSPEAARARRLLTGQVKREGS